MFAFNITPEKQTFPNWVSEEARRYVAHTEAGQSIRSLAREAGCHASTIMRQVRRFEGRRDDLLVDLALKRIGALGASPESTRSDEPAASIIDDKTLRAEAPRILRRLNEPGACLAIAANMEKAVVARDDASGQTIRTAILDCALAEAMALQDWISPLSVGRIMRYRITQYGRQALKHFLAEDEGARAMFDGRSDPSETRGSDISPDSNGASSGRSRRARYHAAESPLLVLSRRKDTDGKPFLSAELVAAGERLREDFELARIQPELGKIWNGLLVGRENEAPARPRSEAASAARRRVTAALADLGPGLGDVVLRCCCLLEGIEVAEQRMGWSARSGKIVLRIALLRLQKHYDEASGNWSPLIG